MDIDDLETLESDVLDALDAADDARPLRARCRCRSLGAGGAWPRRVKFLDAD